MKANAPEKLYLRDTGILGDGISTGKLKDTDIEYTRTDAFIEKAEKFLEDNLTEEDCKFGWSEWTEVKSGYNSIDSFIRAFRTYMKGE